MLYAYTFKEEEEEEKTFTHTCTCFAIYNACLCTAHAINVGQRPDAADL